MASVTRQPGGENEAIFGQSAIGLQQPMRVITMMMMFLEGTAV
jgi:hypothetical protein